MPEWLIERGIGETRAALVDRGAIIEARIELEGAIPAGSIVAARLISAGTAGRNAIARDQRGDEYLLPRGARGVSEGTSVNIEVARAAIPGTEAWKRPLALLTGEAPHDAPLGSRRCRARSAIQAIGYPADLQQHARLGERQADDVGIAAGDMPDIHFAITLKRIAAGLAAPLAVTRVMVDLLPARGASSRSSFRPAARECLARNGERDAGSARGAAVPRAAACRRATSLHPPPWAGCAARTATTVSAASTTASGSLGGDRFRFLARQAPRMFARQLALGHALVDIGGNHRVGNDSDAGEKVETARARGSEDQPHLRIPGGPARPGMKR